MGFFDLFTKKTEGMPSRNSFSNDGLKGESGLNQPFYPQASAQPLPMQVRRPRSFEDVEEIIDLVKHKKSVILHTNEIAPNTLNRVLDILSGAVYALDGGISELEKGIYVISPAGVDNRA